MLYKYKELDGFVYHVTEDPTGYIRKWLRMEWEKDALEFSDQPWTTEWMENIMTLKFRLEEVAIGTIKPRIELMTYEEGGYSFQRELNERVAERLTAIQMGTSVMPLVIRAADRELLDGYTRFETLKKFGAQRVYAYVGYADGNK